MNIFRVIAVQTWILVVSALIGVLGLLLTFLQNGNFSPLAWVGFAVAAITLIYRIITGQAAKFHKLMK